MSADRGLAWFLTRIRAHGRLRSAVGVLAAGALLIEVNVLAARRFVRFDATADSTYTLSEPTRALLAGLDEPVEITSLLPKSDPLSVDLRHGLDAYRAASPALRVRFVDPERDVAAFRALEREIDAESGEGDVTLAEASLVVEKGSRRWFVGHQELVSYGEDGSAQFRLESLLTEAIARVDETTRRRVCFVTGHGERSIDDASAEGLIEFSRRLERSNLEAVRTPLDVPDPARALDACDVVAVVGPERPFPERSARALAEAYRSGKNLLLFVDPLVSGAGDVADAGLDEVLDLFQIRFESGFVIETDATRRLPRGIGEVFFTEVKPHAVTRGLSQDDARVDARPIAIGMQALVVGDASAAIPLLESSPASFVLVDPARFEPPPEKDRKRHVLAVAFEEPASAPGPGATARHRAIVAAGSAFAGGDSFRDPALYGNRLFAENALAYVTERPALVSVPEPRARSGGLVLSEESLGDVFRYVTIYMPLTAASIGAFLLLRRRSAERRSRGEVS